MRQFKLRWVLTVSMLGLCGCGGSGNGVVQPTATAPSTGTEALKSEPTKAQGDAWIQAMHAVQIPEGGACFEAHYPTVAWIQVQCSTREPPPPTQPPKFMLRAAKKILGNDDVQPPVSP